MKIEEILDINKLDKSKFTHIQGINFCFDQIEFRFYALQHILFNNIHNHALAVSTAWDFIDWCIRLKRMLEYNSGPEIKRTPWKKALRKFLESLTSARNFFQHINEQMNDQVQKAEPTFGYLSFVSNRNEGKEAMEIIYPTGDFLNGNEEFSLGKIRPWNSFNPPIDHIILFVKNDELNLTKIHSTIKEGRKEFLNDLIVIFGKSKTLENQ